MHPGYFVRERQRVWLFGLALPVIAAIGVFFSPAIPLAVAVLYGLSYARTTVGLWRAKLPVGEALSHARFLSLSKFPQFLGMITYYWRKWRRQQMLIIEHK